MLRSFTHAARSSSKAEEAQRRTWDRLGLVVVTEAFTEEAALESWHRNGYIQVDWKSHGTRDRGHNVNKKPAQCTWPPRQPRALVKLGG